MEREHLGSESLPSIEAELAGSRTQAAPSDWLSRLLNRHKIGTRTAGDYLSQSAFYKDNRWDITDSEAKYWGVCETQARDDRINRRFMDIINDIIDYCGSRGSRRTLATDFADDEWDDLHYDYERTTSKLPDYSTRPDLVILGKDAKQFRRPLESYTSNMSTTEEDRRKLYRGCVAFGKVERVQRKRMDRMLEKVATCAR